MLAPVSIGALLALIVGAHIALWLTDAPFEAKLRLTVLNALGWSVILLPALGVSLWLKVHRHRGQTRQD
jgi:hypothetical protein